MKYLLLVKTECVISCESFVTNIALVWFHTGVQFDMLFQVVISKNYIETKKYLRNCDVTMTLCSYDVKYYDVMMRSGSQITW